MSGLGWYVIHCHPRREAFVRDRVRDFGRDVFLPLISERRRKTRHRSLVPLFPGYIFSKLSEADGDLARVRWTHGVQRILGSDGLPSPIDERVVEALRERVDRTGRVKLRDRFRTGDRVRIWDGALAGLIGVIEREESTPTQRVWVLLELFHRLTRVELPSTDVCSVSGSR